MAVHSFIISDKIPNGQEMPEKDTMHGNRNKADTIAWYVEQQLCPDAQQTEALRLYRHRMVVRNQANR